MGENEAQDIDGLLRETEQFLQELRKRLPEIVRARSLSTVTRVPLKVCVAKDALLYRMTDITQACMHLYEKRFVVPAYILTRAAFETASMLYLLCKRARLSVTDGQRDELEDLADRLLCGSASAITPKRADGGCIKPIRIGKALEEFNKEFPGMTSEYGVLCEFAHPNCLGAFVAYALPDQKDDSCKFGFEVMKEKIRQPGTYGLHGLLLALEAFKGYYDELTEMLPKVITMCEQQEGQRPEYEEAG